MGRKGKASSKEAPLEQPAADGPADTKQKQTEKGAAKDDIDAIFDGPSRASASAQPAAADEQKQKKKRAKDELDDIFSGAKKSAAGQQAEEDGQEAATNPELESIAKQVKEEREKLQADTKKAKIEGSKDDIFGAAAGKARKRTEEGFTIYSEEELGLSKKGGNTDLCPFDCDCCY